MLNKEYLVAQLLKTKPPTVDHEPCKKCYSKWQLTRSGLCKECRPTLRMGSKKHFNGGRVFQGSEHIGHITDDAI